jgi:hypothetical protein
MYKISVLIHRRTIPRPRWAGSARTLRKLSVLTAEPAALLTQLSCDGARWIHALVRQRGDLPEPVPRHRLALKALDKVSARTMSQAGIGDRHAMWATATTQPTWPASSAPASPRSRQQALYRSSLLKEQMREVFRVKVKYGGSCWPGGCRGRRTCASRSSLRSPEHPRLLRVDPQHARPRPVQRPLGSH